MEALLRYLKFFPGYAVDLINLISSPKIFLKERNTACNDNWFRALRFFGFSVLVSALLRQFSLWSIEFQNKVFLQTVATFAAIAIVAVLFGAASIKVAWKIVGGKASFDSIFLTHVYGYSVFTIWMFGRPDLQ